MLTEDSGNTDNDFDVEGDDDQVEFHAESEQSTHPAVQSRWPTRVCTEPTHSESIDGRSCWSDGYQYQRLVITTVQKFQFHTKVDKNKLTKTLET